VNMSKTSQMTQLIVRSRQFDPFGILVYKSNRPKGKARGIGYSSGSSRLSIQASMPSWRQPLWPGQSLTQNTRQTGTTFGVRPQTRRVRYEDVLNCRTTTHTPGEGFPNLDLVPGRTLLDKKAWLGGFDPTELPVFHKQKELAEWPMRRLQSLGLVGDLRRLTTAILDLQRHCRHKVCREQGINRKPGPKILSMLHPELSSLAAKYFPESGEVDEQFCQGVLWQETDLCSVWWHELDGFAQEIAA
jgi:hypothetical protein